MICLAPGVSAFTYWINGPGGDVITLLRARRTSSSDADTKDPDLVIRFSTVLVPGQTQRISVPGIHWGNPPTFRISRIGEAIDVTSSNTDRKGNDFPTLPKVQHTTRGGE